MVAIPLGPLRIGAAPRPARATVIRWTIAQGVVAAMAMTGMREVTTRIGLLDRVPPEEVAEDRIPGILARLTPERRAVAIQLMHWGYGAAAGAAFAALPDAVRRRAGAGPAYGAAVWLAFEAGIAPLLGLTWRRKARERLALLADHLLYGAVIGAGPR